MRISDWSSDVCSSDLQALPAVVELAHDQAGIVEGRETNTDREIEPFGDHVDRPVDALEVHGNRRVRLHETRDQPAELELPPADRAGHSDHPPGLGVKLGDRPFGLLCLDQPPDNLPINTLAPPANPHP